MLPELQVGNKILRNPRIPFFPLEKVPQNIIVHEFVTCLVRCLSSQLDCALHAPSVWPQEQMSRCPHRLQITRLALLESRGGGHHDTPQPPQGSGTQKTPLPSMCSPLPGLEIWLAPQGAQCSHGAWEHVTGSWLHGDERALQFVKGLVLCYTHSSSSSGRVLLIST